MYFCTDRKSKIIFYIFSISKYFSFLFFFIHIEGIWMKNQFCGAIIKDYNNKSHVVWVCVYIKWNLKSVKTSSWHYSTIVRGKKEVMFAKEISCLSFKFLHNLLGTIHAERIHYSLESRASNDYFLYKEWSKKKIFSLNRKNYHNHKKIKLNKKIV